jgi:phosphohistidine swiveling domain-containing protein
MHLLSINIALSENEVGGKAASLSKLQQLGVTVPPAFIVPKAVFNSYKKNEKFPTDFETELINNLTELTTPKVIVRSSAVGEDSDSHSFAGQLDSFVVDNTIKDVLNALIDCWKGIVNERVTAYQNISGKQLTEMGVVIQAYVEADYAGVTFTKSPYADDEMYTEYVQGAGEQLVSGKITPFNITSKKNVEVVEFLPFNILKLLKLCSNLQTAYKCELDIEWVAVGNKIYFVQARPITVKTTEKVHWTNTNLNENYPDPISPLLYSVARDSYYHYFKNLANLLQINPKSIRNLEYDFSNTVGIWGNRLYYNMTSIHNILSSSPLKSYFIDAFNKFVGYTDSDVATSDASKTTSLLKLVWRLIRLNFSLEKHVSAIEKMVGSYAKKVIDKQQYHENKQLFYEFLDLRFHQWYRASLADFFAMIHYKLLGSFTRRFYGEKSIGVHNVLVQAIPGLISSEPLVDTYKIAQLIEQNIEIKTVFHSKSATEVFEELKSSSNWEEVKKSFEAYLEKWGFRCSGELMFFKENYIDNPIQFVELLQSYIRHEAKDPRLVIAQKDKERRTAMKAFALKILKKRHILFPLWLVEIGLLYGLAALCKQAISSRERVRYKQAEMYFRFKQVVKSIGEQAKTDNWLKEADDIFYLSYKEIGELLSSSSMFSTKMASLVEKRKVEFEEQSKTEFPEHFSTDFGKRPANVAPEIELQEGATEFIGLAASGGRIKAQVKILESVLESDKLNKGDILVTKQTDPGWAMVFPLISGLIVERGGALSHGAIVAREFGIPAVIGIKNITTILKDGQEVILDGNLGKIQVL